MVLRFITRETRKIAMTDYDITQLKSSCLTAAAFIGVTATVLAFTFHMMIG
jgi:hypothetical protein